MQKGNTKAPLNGKLLFLIMKAFSFRRMLIVLHLLLGLHTFSWAQLELADDLKGDYCRRRYPDRCCPGRDDTCTVPILGSVCYCDIFCGRTDGSDCCPDFWSVCGQEPPPPIYPPVNIYQPPCRYENVYYNFTQTLKKNCNTCTCVPRQSSPNLGEFICEEKVCLIIPEHVNAINAAVHLGWQAENYANFYGKTLQEGIAQRLGTFKPTEPTVRMTEIHMITNGPLPELFDTRTKWPGLIQPVKDQGDCASSWALSTTALASDRLAIESRGTEIIELSPQQLLACQNRGQRACEGGHLDKAWYYLRKTGVTTESCFPYTSGQNGHKLRCPFKIPVGSSIKNVRCPNGATDMLYHSTPPYRVGPTEEEIMREILYNGPVQATFRVHEDFFSYKSGVYRYSRTTASLPEAFRQQGWHSVRILGWGTEYINDRPVKYWICANSWGSWWGENGYFRIVRGENECDIEMFIIGVWANLDDHIVGNAGTEAALSQNTGQNVFP